MEKTLESIMKIRFHDCDPFNHLNNSRYIDYMMTARGDQLAEHYGLDIYLLAKEKGIGWVTAQNQISYIHPGFLAEEVTIQTRLLDHSAKSLLMEAIMWNKDKTQLKAVLWVKFVHVDLKTGRSLEHDAMLVELFRQILLPLPFSVSFEERVHQLKNNT